MGWSERIALTHVYSEGWNRSPAQAGCMRQVLGTGALGWPRGMGWGGRWEVGSGWGTHANPWLIHVSVWQKPLQYCKVTSLQLIKINEKNKTDNSFIIYNKSTIVLCWLVNGTLYFHLVCVCVCVCVCACVCVCTPSLRHVTLWDPRDRSPPGSSVHGNFPGKSTGVGCHALL